MVITRNDHVHYHDFEILWQKTVKMSQVQPSQGKPHIASWECLRTKMAKIK
jgi:hypothetical protein